MLDDIPLVRDRDAAPSKVLVVPYRPLHELLHGLNVRATVRMRKLHGRERRSLHLGTHAVRDVVSQYGVPFRGYEGGQQSSGHDLHGGELSRCGLRRQTLVRHGGEAGIDDARIAPGLAEYEADVGYARLVQFGRLFGGDVCQLILVVLVGIDAQHDLGAVRPVVHATLSIQPHRIVHGNLRPHHVMTAQYQRRVPLLGIAQQLIRQRGIPRALDVQDLRAAPQPEIQQVEHALYSGLVVRPRPRLVGRADRVHYWEGVVDDVRGGEWQCWRPLCVGAAEGPEHTLLVQDVEPRIAFLLLAGGTFVLRLAVAVPCQVVLRGL
mmetsp:Transcript_31677/g.76695  ORF Transcript_31677/g.76695 Transcript_31677/m.76695 type:complete len:322 (-) Transcript_31677:830-1795(-)